MEYRFDTYVDILEYRSPVYKKKAERVMRTLSQYQQIFSFFVTIEAQFYNINIICMLRYKEKVLNITWTLRI